MAAPAYLDSNGRVVLPSRLRPPTGGTLQITMFPRPPVSMATLVNADPTTLGSMQWVNDDGVGSVEPLWLASAPPVTDAVAEVDRYSDTFVRVRSAEAHSPGFHVFAVRLATAAGPNGAVLADTAELRAMSGGVWFDNNGSLGKVKLAGTDMTVEELATFIDNSGAVRGALNGNDLEVDVAEAGRRRSTMGDLVPALNDFVIDLVEVNPNEIDITGASPVPPPEPPAPHDRTNLEVYASVADLQKVLGGIGGQDEARCSWALIAASFTVDAYLGRSLPTDLVSDPTVTVVPSTGGVRQATLALAARFYKNPENWSGMLAPDTVGAYVSRYVADLDLYLMGQRERFGIA